MIGNDAGELLPVIQAAKAIVAHFESVERHPETGELDPPMGNDDGICVKVGDLRALRQALSTTATPASDGVLDRLQGAWDSCPDGPGMGLPPIIFTEAEAMHLATAFATTPTPDRFGEGYRAGVDASAKVPMHVAGIIGALPGSSIHSALKEAESSIGVLQADIGGGK